MIARIALFGALSLIAPTHATPSGPSGAGGVFVLGVDGMDPVILQRMMDEGKAPNLEKLAAEGSFQALGTINPPQSPVAWSSFVTGLDPGGHGIFDFVHRDPATYHPMSSATPPVESEPKALHLFGYYLPLSSSGSENNRGGVPFWDRLHDAGVEVEVYRIPGNFPVPGSDAKVLSGMGTVDMRGGYGTYTLFTDTPLKGHPKGDIQRVTVQDYDLDGTPDTATGALKGPPDVFRIPPGQVPQDKDYLLSRVTFRLDQEAESVAIEVGNEVAVLAEGEWSDWMMVDFDALPMGLMPLQGAVRFYARELRPNFQIYASPVNLSPADPPLPITSPDDWAAELFGAVGPYYTQGMPEDTNALKDGALDDDDYIGQVGLVQQDTRRMLEHALSRFDPGDFTFVYLSDIDLQCHMLWRHHDPKYPGAEPHPAYRPEIAANHAHDIERFYRDVDETVGRVRERLPEGSTLIVMSDHGFQPYTRKVHLNAWLEDRGYLVLKSERGGGGGDAAMQQLQSLGYLGSEEDEGGPGDEGARETGEISADDVDWTRTRAYGLGFNGLYINREGRESQGIVPESETGRLEDELIRELTALVDPKNGLHPVLSVAKAREVYHGPRTGEAPDLIVGYDKGYGCSDESTLGGIGSEVFADNRDKWSGNHLMAPEVVPGVLLVNRELPGNGHDLMDITATLLALYGVSPSDGMVGTSIFE